MKIVDFHSHCGIQHNSQYAIKDIVSYLTKTCVIKTVLSSLSSIFSSQYAKEDLIESEQYDVFVPTYWVNPYYKEWQVDVRTLMQCVSIKGIKLHPTANIYDPESSFLRPVFEFCRTHHLFITYHTDTYRSSPCSIAELALEYPDVDIVLLHMDDPINSIFLAKRLSNIYLETSWIERKWNTLAPIRIALDCVDTNKILFGTDFPFEFPIGNLRRQPGRSRDYQEIVDHYHDLLPASVADNILFNNGKNFLARYGVSIHE